MLSQVAVLVALVVEYSFEIFIDGTKNGKKETRNKTFNSNPPKDKSEFQGFVDSIINDIPSSEQFEPEEAFLYVGGQQWYHHKFEKF